ncbi:MAG: hypothetical protein KTR20_14570 [Cellvibrionaceae bacterium]|nr:hypothetical protein [Cellvibrionaceae bacterium]
MDSETGDLLDWDEFAYQGLRVLDALPPALSAPAKVPALVNKAPGVFSRAFNGIKNFFGGLFSKGPKSAGWKADPYYPNWKKELGPKP